jgi:hypothetical protein
MRRSGPAVSVALRDERLCIVRVYLGAGGGPPPPPPRRSDQRPRWNVKANLVPFSSECNFMKPRALR